MKAVNKWSFRPYTELYRPERGTAPYICRLAPGEGCFTADFIDNGAPDAGHILRYRKRGEGDFITVIPERRGNFFTASAACEDGCDFELYAERDGGVRSETRLVRTGSVPGGVINYLHPEDDAYSFSGRYLCSPSLLRLPDGRLLASMDVFDGALPQNLTLIYRSDDNGQSWYYLTELFPCFWGKLFLDGDRLYMLGCSREYGDLLIGRSDDCGESFTMPTVLFRGSSFSGECGLHRAPMQVEISHGRVMTDLQYGAWAKQVFDDAIISAPLGSELLDPKSWVCSEFWRLTDHPEAQLPGIRGGIEGCVVTAPDGQVYDLLRFARGKLLKLRFDPSAPEGRPEFCGFIDFPATQSKVDILFDERSKRYYSIVSYDLPECGTNRNLLSLISSPDLESWRLERHLIDCRSEDPSKIGFQYVSFEFDGDDLIWQCRTAFNSAHSFHDSNYSTFHRLKDFRG